MAANILSVENQQGVDIVASDHPDLFSIAGGSRSGLNASRYVVSSVLDCLAVRLTTGTRAFQVERGDIAAGCLLSRSHRHNVMSCNIKILQLVNLEHHQYRAAAGIIAAITITLKGRGDKCQQEHWLSDWARL